MKVTAIDEKNMVSRLPVIHDDGEVGDLSDVAPALLRPAHEVFPLALQETRGMHPSEPQCGKADIA